MPPSIWPWTDSGLRARPTSCAVATCTTLTRPSSAIDVDDGAVGDERERDVAVALPVLVEVLGRRVAVLHGLVEGQAGRGRRHRDPQRADRVDDVGAVDRQLHRLDAVRRARPPRTAARAPDGTRRRRRRPTSTSGGWPTCCRRSRPGCRSCRGSPRRRRGSCGRSAGRASRSPARPRRWRTSAWRRRRPAGSGRSSSRRSPREYMRFLMLTREADAAADVPAVGGAAGPARQIAARRDGRPCRRASAARRSRGCSARPARRSPRPGR